MHMTYFSVLFSYIEYSQILECKCDENVVVLLRDIF